MTNIQAELLIRENIALAPLTTLKVGGAAHFFVEATSEEQLVAAVRYASDNGLPLFVLGGGSNLLVSDDGFEGLVVKIALEGIEIIEGNLLNVRAGEDWDSLVEYCVGKNLAGVECLSGIPGFAGGTPVQNVGAYGQEVSETIERVRVLDRDSLEFKWLDNADCGFSYRTSIFNSIARDRYIVTAINYRLRANGAPKIAYKDLREVFAGREPTLAETREAVLSIRRAKSMVISDDDPNTRSAGSFFKNPIVSLGEYERITEIAQGMGLGGAPSFPAGAGNVKLPAAWLIENSGFQKGFRLGKAGLSTRHTLALVNFDWAAASDIVALKQVIQEGVREQFGVMLMPEPVFLGFNGNK